MSVHLELDQARIAEFCQRNHIRRLALYGSVLTDEFRSDSDVDVLVEFDSGHSVGLIRMAALEAELSHIIGRKVDLRTPGDLSRYFREQVLATAEVQYAR